MSKFKILKPQNFLGNRGEKGRNISYILVGKDGYISISSRLRDVLGINTGDYVAFAEAENSFHISPTEDKDEGYRVRGNGTKTQAVIGCKALAQKISRTYGLRVFKDKKSVYCEVSEDPQIDCGQLYYEIKRPEK